MDIRSRVYYTKIIIILTLKQRGAVDTNAINLSADELLKERYGAGSLLDKVIGWRGNAIVMAMG